MSCVVAGSFFSADDSLAIEQAVVDWLDILGYASDEGAGQAVGVLVDEIAGNEYVFDLFFDLVEKYAYGPDSPVFDEELFDKMLARVIASDAVDGADKIRPRYLRLQIAMNHPGTPAADFTYETPDGLCAQMSSIRAPYLLIYFYDPDCEECKMLAGDIERSPVLAPMIGGGQLCVLALYAGEDRTLWRRQLYDIPAQWINACDPRGEVADVLYALRAIPSLYLLGHDKTVILKDAAFGRVEDLLMGEVHKNRL